MALRGDRIAGQGVTIQYFMNATGERGGVVIHSSTGSGVALDDANAQVATPTGQAPSGTNPAGALLNDVVNLDLTRQHLNQHKDEVQLGGKVTVLREGWIVTDVLATGISITAGERAYYNTTGQFTNADAGSAPQVGRFASSADSDGYAGVFVRVI